VLGSKKESELCERIASSIGLQAKSVAGLTSLPELSALLSRSLAIISNDSGGMHLASACGAKLVAVFGITDPVKTGPLGKNCMVMTADGVKGCREIRKDDPNAISVLRSIKPQSVITAAEELING
jgi:heptosyltransferase II